MGGIIGESEVLIKRNGKWYRTDMDKYNNGDVDLFFSDNPNPSPKELPWYIEFISEANDG